MDEITLTALRGSIKKWEEILHRDGKDFGSDNCPLCDLFISEDCKGCPVSIRTNQGACYGTPYVKWCNLQDELDLPLSLPKFSEDKKPKAREVAQAKLDFLKSLLPKDERSE